MPIIYRTAGAWGAGKGSNLTPAEVDENFYDVVQRLEDLESGAVATVNQIDSIQVIGSQMTFFMEDASTFGPFTLPIAMLRWRGEWEVDTEYDELDLIFVGGEGTFIVLQDHTSDPYAFDPNETLLGNPVYFKIYGDSFSILQMTDVADSFVGAGGYDLRVNDLETAVEFVPREETMVCFHEGLATSEQVIHRENALFPLVIPEHFEGSWASSGVPADTSQIFSIRLNGVEIGTLEMFSDNTFAFIATTPPLVEIGDVIEIVAPTSVDGIQFDIAITLLFERQAVLVTA